MEGYWWGGKGEEGGGGKVQGLGTINDRYKIDRGKLRIA